MAEQKKERIRIRVLRVKDTDDDKAIYAKLRKRRFTAAEWQKFTEIEPEGIPAEQVLAEMEAIDREETEKRKQREEKKNRKRKKA
ncbi:MAG TPA: hypothetical protein VMF69_06875 [Gemmataceae bacterium]|nr:hypothetical protein [Gemmataceae bacterium]